MWSFGLFDTITGEPLVSVEPSSGSWRRTFGTPGSGTHQFQLRASELTAATWRDVTLPWARTLVVMWLGVPVYAGLITGRPRKEGVLTLRHADVRSLFTRRYTFGVTTFPSGDLSVSSRSLPAVVRAIVLRGAGGSWGATWDLPFDYPADASGPYSFAWKRYGWHTIEDLLRQVEQLEGGPHIDFAPKLTAAGWLRYDVLVGNPLLPGVTFEFPVNVDEPLVKDVEIDEDGLKQLTGAFVIGAGSEADMRFGEAGFVSGPAVPTLDASRSAKDVSSTSQLNSQAMGDLVSRRSATVQANFDLVAEQDEDGTERLDVAALQPGARLRLGFFGDTFEPDGWMDSYLVGISGDMSRTLKPEVQPL